MMKHRIPFDFCDDCGGKFSMDNLQKLSDTKYLCLVCADRQPDSWRAAKHPEDDYDHITKSGDDK